ncbi:aspartate-semialdehyde dehydrogenase [Thermosporothrix hazakensis]|jgi:aspartate-semialdehyde dehydrogenase|uniref:Aspartate-semialdehyde dehydrogenase n=2 Tax=Thermosporothrix TaxID=768650 RepID=A0A326UFI5_THEHA|nr:aspartate-semialdehyde dehydrogenase [Thermosporothrix hazakensis]PZW36655.1 aspartate-semialdehyde dehydrogenase [Thermosporothrix hazakensis]BBH89122.1 aspartate-semialdehyde dehydrogenase [Thermosporothrix sp. COM3]GCE47305.1 aspartate-semialdehyde dehydrogenase [Thermosporothrix hazakensis]
MASQLQQRIPVAVLGATGMVGQRFIELLHNHPWFELVGLAASEQHGGRPYGEVARWRLPESDMPASVASLPVVACRPEALPGVRVVFSALPGEVAGEIEEAFARAGVAVFSNAKNHRMAPDVPLLIPEVNADHVAAIQEQRQRREWPGFIITNANCSATPLVMALKPLQQAFGIKKAILTTLQAISGAGYPGLPSYDIVDNVIPYIGGEEEKLERETRKMLGTWEEGRGFVDAPLAVSAHCTRVPTREGHLECVSIELERQATPEDIIAVWTNYQPEPQQLKLPTAPAHPLIYRYEEDRPQTVRDRNAGRGMTATIGRLRPCPILSYKFVVLGHNTIRGAAGGSVLNAELCVQKGLL